jgi:hypothetical protein
MRRAHCTAILLACMQVSRSHSITVPTYAQEAIALQRDSNQQEALGWVFWDATVRYTHLVSRFYAASTIMLSCDSALGDGAGWGCTGIMYQQTMRAASCVRSLRHGVGVIDILYVIDPSLLHASIAMCTPRTVYSDIVATNSASRY